MKRLTFLIAIFTLMFIFSGCGQSGPLYIADDPSQMAVPPSRDTANQEEEQEEENGESSESD